MIYNDPRPTGAAPQSAQGFVSGMTGGVAWQGQDAPPPAVGLERAGSMIDRLGKQLIQIYEALQHRHGMIYGPVPQAVDNAKAGGGSGLLYELGRLSEAADQISQLASSL